MKKVFAILFVAAIAVMAACTSKIENAVDSTAAVVDSVATAAVDSAAAAVDSAAAAVDSAASAVTKTIKK